MKRLLAKLSNSQKNKAVKKFAKKHPHFVKQAKVLYPIDDLLLFQDPLLHQVTLSMPRPEPHQLGIPPHLLGDLLYITDLMWTFREVMQVVPFSLESLYNSLCERHESPLLREILMALVRIILESCINKDAETQLLPASHLTLLCKLVDLTDISAIVSVCYLTLLSELLRSPMWKVYTEDSKELVLLLKHKLAATPLEDVYYHHFSYEIKMALLIFATHCLFDTKAIHEDLANRLEEQQKLAKLRQEIKVDIRNIEAKAKAKDKNGSVTRLNQTNTDKIQRLEAKLRKETEALNEMTLRTQSLGLDRDYREYFLFDFDRTKLYVRLPTPLDAARRPKDETGYWYVYHSQEEVEQILESLCPKGIRESVLCEGLTAALPKFKFGEDDVTEAKPAKPYTNKYSSFRPIDCTLDGIRQALLSLEQSFTQHLAKTSKQWELPIPRKEWLEVVRLETDLIGLAQLLLDFGTKANTPYKTVATNQPTSEDEEQDSDDMHYRRVNLRIWQDFGEAFSLWSYLLSESKSPSSVHFCILMYGNVLQNYYRKRPDRGIERRNPAAAPQALPKAVVDDPRIKTRRACTEGEETKGRKRGKITVFEHDDVCFFCGKYGELMCCETCIRVVHPSCIGLEAVPSEDWYCDECLSKHETIPQTRSRTKLRK